MSKPTEDQKADAKMHATVWESVFHTAQENANRRTDLDRNVMTALATFALMVGGEYRRIGNGKDIDD
jgi:hypothetical protein